MIYDRVLENISDSVVAINTAYGTHFFPKKYHFKVENVASSLKMELPFCLLILAGSHCLDLRPAAASDDPEWLGLQRENEVDTIQGWISQYYSDLKFRG